jgi:hypothetical protein
MKNNSQKQLIGYGKKSIPDQHNDTCFVEIKQTYNINLNIDMCSDNIVGVDTYDGMLNRTFNITPINYKLLQFQFLKRHDDFKKYLKKLKSVRKNINKNDLLRFDKLMQQYKSIHSILEFTGLINEDNLSHLNGAFDTVKLFKEVFISSGYTGAEIYWFYNWIDKQTRINNVKVYPIFEDVIKNKLLNDGGYKYDDVKLNNHFDVVMVVNSVDIFSYSKYTDENSMFYPEVVKFHKETLIGLILKECNEKITKELLNFLEESVNGW